MEKVLESGNLVLTPELIDFEERVAKYTKSKYCIGLNSGTDALMMGLHAMGIGKGDEVITSPISFIATTAAIAHVGATPVYVDVGEDQNIEKAAIGSAGGYTFLNNEPFPYGTKNMPLERERYEWFLSTQVLFIIGDKDDDSNHSTLNLSRGARKQGDHRLERGQNYFKNLVEFGQEFQMPFRWRYKVVSNLDHNTEEMTKNASSFLLNELDYKD